MLKSNMERKYEENDWFDCEMNANYKFQLEPKQNEPHRKTWKERWGVEIFGEWLNYKPKQINNENNKCNRLDT